MKKNTRREFLRSGVLMASLTAFSTPRFLKDEAILRIDVSSIDPNISLLQSGGLNGIYSNPDLLGGLQAIQMYIQSKGANSVLLDSGNFIDPDQSIDYNLEYLKELINTGLSVAAIGNHESELPPQDLHFLVKNSNLKVLGNSLEKNGLVLGETYFSKAIIQWGKFKVGILPTRNASLSEINRRGLELKLLHQCDMLIGLGPLPLSGDLKQLVKKHHEVNHYFVDSEDKSLLGTQVFKTSKGMEFWVSKPGNHGKYLGVFAYTINQSYKLNHFSNYSCIPGEATWNKKMAILSQSSHFPNPKS
jgi:hypothetical protein